MRSWRVLRVLLVCVWVWIAGLGSPIRAARTDFTVEQVLSQLRREAERLPTDMRSKQAYTLSSPLKTWRFTGEAVRNGDRVSVRLDGAPSFIPNEILDTLFDLPAILNDFSVNLAGNEVVNGKPLYILEGTRKPNVYTGAVSARVWVDPQTWTLPKAEARYTWGLLVVEQTFREVAGYLVPDRQVATARLLGIKLQVTYTEYEFGK